MEEGGTATPAERRNVTIWSMPAKAADTVMAEARAGAAGGGVGHRSRKRRKREGGGKGRPA